VRRMVRFQQADLRQLPRLLGSFDVVLCRNVLIYFDMETKSKILQSIRGTMATGGILLLGGSETLLNIDASFERKLAGPAVYYEKNS
jgi:chemotaxis protein methyltransferase CheR